MKRAMSVAGSFYPLDPRELEQFFFEVKGELPFRPKALISPHAGYIYSGGCANELYSLSFKMIQPQRVVVVGLSHRIAFEGVSVSLQEEYETPLGSVKIDTEYAQEIITLSESFGFAEVIHQEHSTETQLPFIKHYFPHASVVEMIYGKCSYEEIAKAIHYILEDEANLVVISTDLSHFYDLQTAKKLDSICIEGIEQLDLSLDAKECEACGIVGVKALLKVAQEKNYQAKLICYTTSAKISGDTSSVVGYGSFVVG